MSLSSLLLGSKAVVDSGLDSLFKVATPQAPPTPGPSKKASAKKRKHDADQDDADQEVLIETPSKRSKSRPEKLPELGKAKKTKSVEKTSKSEKAVHVDQPQKKVKGKGKEKEKAAVADSEDEDDNSDLENAYATGKTASKAVVEGVEEEMASDGAEDPTTLVHESLRKGAKKTPRPKQKFVPEDETPDQRDQRTIFVGNLPIEIASKKPLTKQLQRHILSFVPTAKIESVRFRSIPFQAPTAKLPTSDDEGDGSKAKPKPQAPKKDVRAHDRERMSAWRSKLDDKDEDVIKNDEKKYINPGQKKKIAFINQEFHTTADTMNAYIVFAHPVNTENRPSNLPPLPPTLNPYAAALSAAEKCDGTLFMERMIRVDLIGKNKDAGASTGTTDKKPSLIDTDPKLSVFVGNLDFASKEEDLRVFFEGVMSTEKGPPLSGNDDEEEVGTRKPLTWVTRVRIVRDKDTQLGKGFAYVQFSDRECVDELLALEEEKLKFAKRKLRVQRCKTVPGSKLTSASSKSTKPAHVPIIVPKGDPALGEKLAGLSKDERKQHKSTDADRVARRLAKKKARMAMAPGVGIVKSKGKERDRVRKTPGQFKSQSGGKKDNKSKGRVRSAESASRKNTKK
ncbi:hypothetical protein B0H34DRAFT_657128 [Crassisporium funariophilum]|nr:hypothetical protein B0H34DRAFT_657128 [Crassisporium funariophilum]